MLARRSFASVLVAAVLCLLAGNLVWAAKPLKLRLLGNVPVVDGVYLDGHGPYRFVLDTGAQRSRISATLAASLGWTMAFRTRAVTQTHSVMRDGFRASHVRLGEIETTDEEFVAASFADIQKLDPNIEGFLGQSFLGKLDYLIDFRHKQLKFGSATFRGGVKTAFDLSHGCMVTPTSHGQLTLDSGATTVVLYDPGEVVWKGSLSLFTTEGQAIVRRGELPRLRVAGQEFRKVDTAASGRGKYDATDSDGLLPASLFSSLYVSNSGGYVVFNPEN